MSQPTPETHTNVPAFLADDVAREFTPVTYTSTPEGIGEFRADISLATCEIIEEARMVDGGVPRLARFVEYESPTGASVTRRDSDYEFYYEDVGLNLLGLWPGSPTKDRAGKEFNLVFNNLSAGDNERYYDILQITEGIDHGVTLDFSKRHHERFHAARINLRWHQTPSVSTLNIFPGQNSKDVNFIIDEDKEKKESDYATPGWFSPTEALKEGYAQEFAGIIDAIRVAHQTVHGPLQAQGGSLGRARAALKDATHNYPDPLKPDGLGKLAVRTGALFLEDVFFWADEQREVTKDIAEEIGEDCVDALRRVLRRG